MMNFRLEPLDVAPRAVELGFHVNYGSESVRESTAVDLRLLHEGRQRAVRNGEIWTGRDAKPFFRSRPRAGNEFVDDLRNDPHFEEIAPRHRREHIGVYRVNGGAVFAHFKAP